MSIAENMIPEFDLEIENTRRVLERVKEADFAWKPHEKSFDLKKLATHVADIPSWVTWTFKTDELDIAPTDGSKFEQPKSDSTQDLLDHLKRGAAEGRAALLATPDESMHTPWTLKAGGQTIFTIPRIGVYRGMVMNHLIHHRGQLTVYLRLLGVPLPAIYGPTADEQAFG